MYCTVPATSTQASHVSPVLSCTRHVASVLQCATVLICADSCFGLWPQGAIKAADKAKQAKDGIQLVRLSFPPSLQDPDDACRVVSDAVAEIYGR